MMKILVIAGAAVMLLGQPAVSSEWMGSFFGTYTAPPQTDETTFFGRWSARVNLHTGKAKVTTPFGTGTGQLHWDDSNKHTFSGTFGPLGSVEGKTTKGDKVLGTFSGVVGAYSGSGAFQGHRK